MTTKPTYCTQPDVSDCQSCSLANYNRDCMNERINKPGRRPHFDKRMKQTSIYLPDDMLDYLRNQDVSISVFIRALIDEKRADDKRQFEADYLMLHPMADEEELDREYSIFQAS